MKNALLRWTTHFTLGLLAFVARRPGLEAVSRALTRALARGTVRFKGIGRAQTVEQLGLLWQRSFPSRKQVPIESTTERTVLAQIHTRCPLRGSGDLAACHRMMEFDREVLRHVGGQFVVLQSQATPGVSHCRVAMRREGEALDDLVPTHTGRT